VLVSGKITALLVYENSDTLSSLENALRRQRVGVIQAESCAQAQRRLGGLNPAPLVFTDTQLPDGTWADILALAEKAALPVNVIVVAPAVNTRLYVEAIESGAFDFVAPPFNAADLAYVVRCALDNALARRTARLPAVHAVKAGLFAEVRETGAEAIRH
jgi:DNA-binding NtrC family response regulator